MPSCSMNMDNIRNECLKFINIYRKRHNLEPLIYEHELETSAIIWSHVLARIDKNVPSIDSGRLYGENIFIKKGALNNLTGWEIATTWYAGGYNYKYNAVNPTMPYYNFTQIIWASTREFGLGIIVNDSGVGYIVGHFRQMGNIPGVFRFNVFPPCQMYEPMQPSLEEMNIIGINEHNMYREYHGVPPLSLCHNLIASAQKWAEFIAPLKGKIIYSNTCSVSESIAHLFNPLGFICSRRVTEVWYKPGKDYEYDNQFIGTTLDSFTNIIWKTASLVGFGRATCGGHHYMVAHYTPPGKLIDLQDNVKRVLVIK